jgi:uncharacterized protein (UPF0335 family)
MTARLEPEGDRDVKNDMDAPKRDVAGRRDLNRSTIARSLVDRMEECMRAQEDAAADLKAVLHDAAAQEFSKTDIQAMKRIARLRLKDQLGRAREQLAALSRISKAVQCGLFDWESAG